MGEAEIVNVVDVCGNEEPILGSEAWQEHSQRARPHCFLHGLLTLSDYALNLIVVH